MFAAEARVNSDKASRYLVQLCKHFAHKTPAEYDDLQGRIDFQPGSCLLRATPSALVVTCEASTLPDLDRVKTTIEDHIVRFGWRDNIAVEWADRPLCNSMRPDSTADLS